jgi:hypothetical protein
MSELKELQETNEQLFNTIAEAGYGIDPVQILKMRVDIVTDSLITSGALDEAALEMAWETHLNGLLEAIGAEIRTAQLTEP